MTRHVVINNNNNSALHWPQASMKNGSSYHKANIKDKKSVSTTTHNTSSSRQQLKQVLKQTMVMSLLFRSKIQCRVLSPTFMDNLKIPTNITKNTCRTSYLTKFSEHSSSCSCCRYSIVRTNMKMRTKVFILLFTFLCDEFGIRHSSWVVVPFKCDFLDRHHNMSVCFYLEWSVEEEISRSFCVLIS